ncbi:9271_t:CDS:2 [Diversispora eburnea]|uniref:9271_t:CDS:1 n=1 Tax=Diversispora eburnea TaxID=1213867 RepID=A0A9N8VHT6_9GLOM|nr:9271_t:CDS:2 [Diversispora eburnea]
MSDLLIDVQSLQSLMSLLATSAEATVEPKNQNVRFVESINLKGYMDKSCRGWILNINKTTKHMLRLDEVKSQLHASTKAEEVDAIVQALNNSEMDPDYERDTYPIGTVIQILTRLLAYSLQFKRCMSSSPDSRLTSAVVAVSDYRRAQIDLSNPFTTVEWRTLISEFLEKSQTVLRLSVNPFSNPTDDLKAILVGSSPFRVTGGGIQPLDTEATYAENLYRQASGQYKLFNGASHRDAKFIQFGFKEYVRHRIPVKRVSNGAYCCYMDPLKNVYYFTTISFDPFYFNVLKNLLIHEIVTGKAAYIHTAVQLCMSMCTCEEDFKLMNEYGIIQWDFPMEGYESFREKMKELLDVMCCWKFLNTLNWHTEMVKIARHKDKINDTSNWNDFAATCYSGGVLKKELDTVIYKNLS